MVPTASRREEPHGRRWLARSLSSFYVTALATLVIRSVKSDTLTSVLFCFTLKDCETETWDWNWNCPGSSGPSLSSTCTLSLFKQERLRFSDLPQMEWWLVFCYLGPIHHLTHVAALGLHPDYTLQKAPHLFWDIWATFALNSNSKQLYLSPEGQIQGPYSMSKHKLIPERKQRWHQCNVQGQFKICGILKL